MLYPGILVDIEALMELPVGMCKVLGLYKIHFFFIVTDFRECLSLQ